MVYQRHITVNLFQKIILVKKTIQFNDYSWLYSSFTYTNHKYYQNLVLRHYLPSFRNFLHLIFHSEQLATGIYNIHILQIHQQDSI